MVFVLGGVLVVVALVWADLFVRQAGTSQKRGWPQVLPSATGWPARSRNEAPDTRHTMRIRARFNSPYAKVGNWGKPFADRVIANTMHFKGGPETLTPSRLAHAIGHAIDIDHIGKYRFIWRYVTNSATRYELEYSAETYNVDFAHHRTVLAAYAAWGGK